MKTEQDKRKATTTTQPKTSLKVRTQVKASGPVLQHNEKLIRR